MAVAGQWENDICPTEVAEAALAMYLWYNHLVLKRAVDFLHSASISIEVLQQVTMLQGLNPATLTCRMAGH